ncbi:unnamed protein product [Anisakis simplex]|uniref:TSC-22/dip/bun family protein n=1 Tax=Anisakis simplex TaxID=6269 RepID=A0A0M3KHZ4_ANISI|nr:unnamed protein product [Anisakis simplex]
MCPSVAVVNRAMDDHSTAIAGDKPDNVRAKSEEIIVAEKRLSGVIEYLKQKLNNTVEEVERIRAENLQLKTNIAQYNKKYAND